MIHGFQDVFRMLICLLLGQWRSKVESFFSLQSWSIQHTWTDLISLALNRTPICNCNCLWWGRCPSFFVPTHCYIVRVIMDIVIGIVCGRNWCIMRVRDWRVGSRLLSLLSLTDFVSGPLQPPHQTRVYRYLEPSWQLHFYTFSMDSLSIAFPGPRDVLNDMTNLQRLQKESFLASVWRQ